MSAPAVGPGALPLTTPLLALCLYAGWALLLVCVVGGWRVAEVLAGKTRANGFRSGEKHGSDLYWRFNRAQINTAENLGIFASVVLVGHVMGHTSGTFAWCALAVVVARVAQTLAHVSSGRSVAVNVRFAFFATQLGALAWMLATLVGTTLP